MQALAQTLTDGLLFGVILSLAAVGFSLIFGVMGVVNLSHGALVLIGAYMAVFGRSAFGLDPLACIPAVALVMFGVGYVYQRGLIQLAVRRGTLLASLLVTFGVALVLRNLLVLVFSPDIQSTRPAYASIHRVVGGITVDLVHMIGLAASLVLVSGLALALRFLPVGRVIRATAQQEMAAQVCGVDVRHVYALTFAIASAFAGVAGVIVGMLFPFSPSSETVWTLYAFIVVVLGGVGSPAGALLGGALLGVISALTTRYIGAAFPNVVAFGVLVLMLVIRPNGLLGSAFGGSR